jgi:hypothetical protein
MVVIKMFESRKEILLVIVLLIVLLIIFGVPGKSENFDVVDVNGAKVQVKRDPMGWLTSGADLRDQTSFTGTNQ